MQAKFSFDVDCNYEQFVVSSKYVIKDAQILYLKSFSYGLVALKGETRSNCFIITSVTSRKEKAMIKLANAS